jgi:putative membrane-bound dehydrogenase-like protein
LRTEEVCGLRRVPSELLGRAIASEQSLGFDGGFFGSADWSIEVIMKGWFVVRHPGAVDAVLCRLSVTIALWLSSTTVRAAEPIDLTAAALATASADQHERSPAEAIDDDERTRWAGDSAERGHWLTLELSEPRRLTGAKLVWEFPDRRYYYKLEGSADGKTWHTLVDASKQERPGRETLALDAAGLRFVRLTHLGNHWPSVREFRLLGEGPPPPRPKATTLPGLAVEPLNEAEILKSVKVPPEFEATLFAGPPLVDCPVFVAAAPDGTLYVAADRNGSLGRKPKQGRIVRLRDTDHDGRADESKDFVADVDSPRGLVVDGNTVYLLHPPHISAYTDRDGDGTADESRVLVKNIGWTFKDRPADHGSNGLELGIDGWLYAAIGDFGFLEAEGTDGRKLQCRGGGVVRVRPDGTGLELYSFGTRNILEIAMSPKLDGFARDNTNDGGGWNIRFHHFTGGDDHGYPRLFKNFADEIVAPLADYGGGSGCGACWIEDPAWPEAWNKRPYTCDWGRELIGAHTVVESGATFAEPKPPADFARYSRPTDLDIDAQGRAYLASWRNGGFTAGPTCGYILRVQPKGLIPPALPNYKTATSEAFVEELKSPSHRRRLAAQSELRRRDHGLTKTLLMMANERDQPLESRIAALFLLDPVAVEPSLQRLLEDPTIAPWAARALSDRPSTLHEAGAGALTRLAASGDARTRREAVRALGRFSGARNKEVVVDRLADQDPIVRHTAVGAAVTLNAISTCFASLDRPHSTAHERAAALQVLERIHGAQVVDGLIERLKRESAPSRRAELIAALCRLHFVEGPWKGDSWGTRPDTRGPYYQPEPWSETAKIATVLESKLRSADAAEAVVLGRELARHRIQLGDVVGRLIELARADVSVTPALVAYLDREETVPPAALDLLLAAARDAKSDRLTVTLSLRSLLKLDDPRAVAAILEILPGLAVDDTNREAYARVKRAFFVAPHLDRHLAILLKAAEARSIPAVPAAPPIPAAQWAEGVVLRLAFGAGTAPDVKKTVLGVVEETWSDPVRRRRWIAAAEFADDRSLAVRIADDAESDASPTAEFSRETLKRMKLDPKRIREILDPNGPKVAAFTPPEVIERLKSLRGEPWRGEQLFTQLQCAKCHTVRADEPVRGPYLGNIAKNYRREQLTEAILLPSKQLAQGFATNSFVLENGLTRTGFVTQEAADRVTIRDATGAEIVILKNEIEEREKIATSVMPEGLAKEATLIDLASLVDYLEWLTKQEELHGQPSK